MGNINGHETTITASWLRMRLAEPETAQRICLIDATPTTDAFCLPYARPLDVRALVACGLPTADAFQAAVRSIGATSLDQVVIYDRNTPLAASILWRLFRAFGHRDACILDGGMTHGAASPANSRPAIRRTTSEPGGRNACRRLASS
jgi:3-mercaptopyruvate sulfurtransferase SseA